MTSGHPSSSGSYPEREDGDRAVGNQLNEEVALGALLWIRLDGSSWWPVQVTDDKAVSQNNKPRDGSEGEVLVRLYGSYKYMYVDPIKCRSESESMLELNNGDCAKILSKTLEQDLARSKSGRANGKGFKFGGKVIVGSPRDSKAKHSITKKGQEMGSPTSTSGKQARVSHRKLASNTSDPNVPNGNSLPGTTGKGSSGKRKQGEMQKKSEPKSPMSTRISPRRILAGGLVPNMGMDGNSKTKRMEIKRQKQDTVKKKLESNSPDSIRISPRRLFSENTKEAKGEKQKQGRGQKKLQPNHPNSARESPRGSSAATKYSKPETMFKNGELLPEKVDRERKSKDRNKDAMQKKANPSPSIATTSAGKSQELSARRMKVMQSLGLVAPSGSPFH